MNPSDQVPDSSFMADLRREFAPDQLVTNLAAGLVAGAIELTVVVAFATLIFSGDMVDYVPRGMGFMLMGGIAIAVALAFGSSIQSVIAGPQDSSAAIIALIVLALANDMTGASHEAVFITTIAAMTIAALGTGLVFFLFGVFDQGNLVRFIPYPVIGGFLAGTGLLLLEGGISIMAEVTVNPTELDAFTNLDLITKWLPGMLFAVTLTVLIRRYSHALLVPGVLLATAAIFYGALLTSGTSISEATEQGWLMEKFQASAGGLWQPLSLSEWEVVDWDALGNQAGNFAAIIIVSLISILLNATGLELATERDVNLNQDLQAAGIGNMFLGLGGGLVGFHLLSSSALSYRMGSRSRLPGLIAAGMFVLALFVGGNLIVYFPKLILGGLVLFLGLDFLISWLYDTWAKLPKIDFAIIVLIMLVIERVGFLEGIGLGMVVSIVSFVVNYSRVNVIKHTFTGQTYRSAVLRPLAQNNLLDNYGDELIILKLQGFVFFGTANRLFEEVRDRFHDPDCAHRGCVLLDFHAVTGLDSSATLSFVKMRQLAQQHEAVLLFTALSPQVRQQLEPDVLQGDADPVCKIFIDMDHGVEWAENQIINKHQTQLARPSTDHLAEQLESTLTDHQLAANLIKYLTHDKVAAGICLVRQGDPPSSVIFVWQGCITIQLEREQARPVRLRTMTESTFVGEIGVYLNRPATASVIAVTPASISYLTVEALQRMEAEEPEVASAFHRFMARSLSERVMQTTNTLKALID